MNLLQTYKLMSLNIEEQQTAPQYPWYHKKQKKVSDKNLFRSDSFYSSYLLYSFTFWTTKF